jgi:hypothetical protein
MTGSIARRLRRLEQPSPGNIGLALVVTIRLLDAERDGAEAAEIERLRRECSRACSQAAGPLARLAAELAERQAEAAAEAGHNEPLSG